MNIAMSNGRFYCHQWWVVRPNQMNQGYDILIPFPCSFCPQYDQVGGPDKFCNRFSTRKPRFNYPHPETDIYQMSVEQTRNWIWHLGHSCEWEYEDICANAISFSEKQIDGRKIFNLGVIDLHKLNVVKKLGHVIDIVMAVKAIKSRVNITEQHIRNCSRRSVIVSQTASVSPLLESSPIKPRVEKLGSLPIHNIDQGEQPSVGERNVTVDAARRSFLVPAPIENPGTTTILSDIEYRAKNSTASWNNRNTATQRSSSNIEGNQLFSAPGQSGAKLQLEYKKGNYQFG